MSFTNNTPLFIIQNGGNSFFTEAEAYSGVQKIADKVREDIERVTGYYPPKSDSLTAMNPYPIIYGTVGKSPILNSLQERQLICLDAIIGKREVYSFQLVQNPFEGVKCALVIAGSDKRGTIYGLFHLSECMGVSPLVDWSHVMPAKRPTVKLSAKDCLVSKEPSVKYRGIFINDEWPAFGTWCNHRFGGFNAACYSHVFELLLRLKGNYLWPAMWSACFSMDGPGLDNAILADELGIVIGTSHHEPCMRNGEEYSKLRGKNSIYGDAWNFRANPEGITRFWEDGLKRNSRFENIITVGMRGEQDTAILGKDATLKDNIELLHDVISTQNRLITENCGSDLENIPRLLVIFTEVEAFFYGDKNTPGLIDDPVLDGITLMLSDDNFGNLRSVPTPKMLEHKGGYGLYYHFDFHGGAYAYDWMNTNHLPKIWEQLTMAYDSGIRDVWVVNIGDICFLEYPLTYYFELAYDMEKWGSSKPNMTKEFTRSFVEKQFAGAFSGSDFEHIQELLEGYTKINHNRKPEILHPQTYHPVHFKESEGLLRIAGELTKKADTLLGKCPAWATPAFYELVYYPAVASLNLLKMQLLSGRNQLYASQNRVEANYLADEISHCITKDRQLSDTLHQIDNGRWYGMALSEHVGFISWVEEGNLYPPKIYIEPANKPRIIVAKSDSTQFTAGLPWTGKPLSITDFLRPDISQITVDIALASKQPVPYTVKTDCGWLSLSHSEGCVTLKDTLTITLNRNLFQGRVDGTVFIETGNAKVTLNIAAENIEDAVRNSIPPMTFLETNHYIAMEAEHYAHRHDTAEYSFTRIDDYGRTLSAMKVLPNLYEFQKIEEAPYLEYRFLTSCAGEYELDLYLAPSNPPYRGQKWLLGLQINEEAPVVKNAVADDYRSLDCSYPAWVSGVRDNIHISTHRLTCKQGMNTLRLFALTPGMIFERLVLHSVEHPLPQSYLGPCESFYFT